MATADPQGVSNGSLNDRTLVNNSAQVSVVSEAGGSKALAPPPPLQQADSATKAQDVMIGSSKSGSLPNISNQQHCLGK